MNQGWTSHAVERATKRYGITFDPQEWRQMLLEILAVRAGEPGRALFVGSPHTFPGTAEYQLMLGDRMVKVSYDPNTACIVTVVPLSRKMKGSRYNIRGEGQTRRERVREEEW